MASIRGFKRDVDFLTEEIVTDCYLALYFNQEEKKREDVVSIIEKAVDFRNEMFHRANNSPEKKNRSLNKKHFAQLRREMMVKIDEMFEKLSEVCK